MKIKIRRNGKYVYVIETELCQPPNEGSVWGYRDSLMAGSVWGYRDSLMAHVRDITDHHSCVEMSEEGESAIHDFSGAEHFILVQLNDEMLHQCASLMGGAVDHFVNQLVEYLNEQGFAPVPVPDPGDRQARP